MESLQHMIKRFHNSCKELPNYICCVCNRLMFRQQVVAIKQKKYTNKEIFEQCVSGNNMPKYWVCKTCHSKLLADKVPNQARINKLNLQPLVSPLDVLNQLERHLISPIIPFMKIMTTKNGCMVQWYVCRPMFCR